MKYFHFYFAACNVGFTGDDCGGKNVVLKIN